MYHCSHGNGTVVYTTLTVFLHSCGFSYIIAQYQYACAINRKPKKWSPPEHALLQIMPVLVSQHIIAFNTV